MRFSPLVALLFFSAPAIAQDAQPADKTAEKPAEKQICRRVEVTGSYLPGKRECHTKAEWERRAEQARDSFSRRNSRALSGDNYERPK